MDDLTTVPITIERAAKGGNARAANLSSDRKTEIAKAAAESRWGADLPRATHDGPLHLGDSTLMAAVLPNGKRLIVQGTMLMAIGRSRTPKAGTGGTVNVDGLPFFLSADALKPFITDELRVSTTPIFFRLKSGQRAVGYDAHLLPLVCKVYQRFRDSLVKELTKGTEKEAARARSTYSKYEHIIARCDELTHGFSQRGIISLVDDATGYRGDQLREDVLRVIAAYMSPTLFKWTQKFRPAFFEEMYKLHGWEYKPGNTKHPQYTGKFITKYVYRPLPPGVLEEMKSRLPKNESGNRRAKLWQTLSADTGIPHLDKQIEDIVLLMQTSDDKNDFIRRFERRFGDQLQLRLQVMKRMPELSA